MEQLEIQQAKAKDSHRQHVQEGKALELQIVSTTPEYCRFGFLFVGGVFCFGGLGRGWCWEWFFCNFIYAYEASLSAGNTNMRSCQLILKRNVSITY